MTNTNCNLSFVIELKDVILDYLYSDNNYYS